MKELTISLPEDVDLQEVKMIVAASLFDQGILSSGQAAKLGGVTRRVFLEEVGKYGVSIFGETEEDIKSYLKDNKNSFERAFGAWDKSDDAEYIIEDIRSSRSFNRKIDDAL